MRAKGGKVLALSLLLTRDVHELWLIKAPQARRPRDQCAADCTTGSSYYCPHWRRGMGKEKGEKIKEATGSFASFLSADSIVAADQSDGSPRASETNNCI